MRIVETLLVQRFPLLMLIRVMNIQIIRVGMFELQVPLWMYVWLSVFPPEIILLLLVFIVEVLMRVR